MAIRDGKVADADVSEAGKPHLPPGAAMHLPGRGTTFVRTMAHPLLCVVANGDGIVPPETARSPYTLSGTRDKALLEVGDRAHRFAHADLFIARDAHARVFDPIAAWLSGPRALP